MSGRGRPSERRAQGRRSRLALAFAVGAFLFGAVGALLPAKLLRTTYSWPPRPLPAEQPASTWYTPLLLARHEPGSISVRLPCALPPPLPDASRPVVVLATARAATAAGGLQVTQTGRGLAVSVGNVGVTHVLLPEQAPAPGCAYRFAISGNRWSLAGGPGSLSEGGSAPTPVVSGLFSSLDLRQSPAPSIDVTTTVYGSRSTIAQTVVRTIAVLAALAALWLVTFGGVPRRRRLTAEFLRRVGLVDAAVVAVLLGWWVVGPSFFDDGWVMAGQKNFDVTRSLSSYYDSFAVTTSLQYWLAWLEHGLFEASNALLVLRIPALVCLLATWVLCRWIFARVAPAAGRAAGWALGTAFLTGALAWGMTLRPEPVVGLLLTGVVACTILFLERGTAGPLAVAAVLVALAVSAHPAGLVTLAPLIVVAPAMLRWVRPQVAVAATIVLAAGALLAVLAVLGSDVLHLRANATSLRVFGLENQGWRDELTRYSLLSRDFYGAPLRRLWVVLALLAVFAYLLRARRERAAAAFDLASPAVGVALLLLIVTPSKLPWHFGALIGLAAIALAAETARLVDEGRRSPGWHVRPFVVIGAAMLAAAWAWSPRNAWSDLDLRTLHWTLGVERHLTFAKAAGAAPIVVLAALAAFELARRRARRLDAAPWRTAAWTVPVVSVPLIVFTIAVLAADAHKTGSWTLTRQNVDTLEGKLGCGLADDSLVPVRDSMRPLPPAGPIPARAAWLPPPPVAGLPGFALAPAGASSPARSPWFGLRPGQRIGFFLTGVPSASETVGLEWGRAGNGGVTVVGAGQVAGDLGSDARPELGYWRFYGAAALPPAPAGANAVRLSVLTRGAEGAGIGLTPPVTYDDEPLDRMLARDRPAVALPNLLTYVPCVRLPAVNRGVADVPKLIVAFRDSTWPLGSGTSPFDEVTELYRLVRLPLSDSPDPPDDVAVYVVDTQLDGATPVPAVPST